MNMASSRRQPRNGSRFCELHAFGLGLGHPVITSRNLADQRPRTSLAGWLPCGEHVGSRRTPYERRLEIEPSEASYSRTAGYERPALRVTRRYVTAIWHLAAISADHRGWSAPIGKAAHYGNAVMPPSSGLSTIQELGRRSGSSRLRRKAVPRLLPNRAILRAGTGPLLPSTAGQPHKTVHASPNSRRGARGHSFEASP